MPSALGRKAVASQNYLASYFGAKVLEEGGNAFDAVIAMSAVLSVVMPHTSGLGGDAFLLAKTPEGLVAYNASGYSPKNFFVRELRDPRDPKTVMIPGLVDLWAWVERRFMRKGLEEVLKPAIRLASEGFLVGKSLAKAVSEAKDMPRSWQEVYGKLRFGEQLKLKEMAEALKVISKDPREFYKGDLAVDIVNGLAEQGVPVELSDFMEFRGFEVKPISTTYKDFTLYELPPNSQGVITLEVLEMVEESNVNSKPYNSLERINEHLKIYALAYEDRDAYVADPRYADGFEILLDKDYVRERLTQNGIVPRELGVKDTTFMVAGDGENEVALIQSLFHNFGSGIVVKQIPFNNRGLGFGWGKNRPEPRKRPSHTLSILMAERKGETVIIGCSAAELRPQVQTQVFEYYADYMLEIDEAVYAPRFVLRGATFVVERRLGGIFTAGDYMTPEVGIVQALKKTDNGYIAVADPRSEGVALSLA
jgi:gamma-glutamyltranspeptidase/glutathione hydrolase